MSVERDAVLDQILDLMNQHTDVLITRSEDFDFSDELAVTGIVLGFTFVDLGAEPTGDPEDALFTQIGRHHVHRAMARGIGLDICDANG